MNTKRLLRNFLEDVLIIVKYEDKTKINTMLDFLTEDHFYVGYICRTLDNYFKNYQKEYYGVRRGHGNIYSRCKQCGSVIEKTGNKRLYCDQCARERELQRYKKYNQKRITTNRKS